ncbi:MAG: DUF4124 domain-containing protein [Panacagrimonas sp.]
MTGNLSVLLFAGALTSVWTLDAPAAGRAYRWVDAAGQVHYSQQRPASGLYQVVEPSTRASAAIGGSAASDAQKRFLESAEAADKLAAEQEARRRQALAESRTVCDKARARLVFLDERTARRLAVENPDGTAARMDDAEFERRRTAVQQQIQEHCS